MGLTSLFNLKGLVIAFAIGAAVAAVPTGIVVYKVMAGSIASLKLGYANAYAEGIKKIAADTKAQDDVALKAAVKAQADYDKEHLVAVTVVKEIDHYVTDNSRCITFGLVRVLNHAASGDSAALSLAAGQSDDACAPVTWRAFAGDITDDYATARLNAAQLNGLIQSVKDIHNAAGKP